MAHDVAYEIVKMAKVFEAADKSHALESRRWKITIGWEYVTSSVQFCHDGAGTTIMRMPGRCLLPHPNFEPCYPSSSWMALIATGTA